jgi:NADH dehydrogenase
MILVTGGTGFVGRALIRQLVSAGYPVRILIRPSPATPNLPRGVSLEVAVAALNDDRSLRAAMSGVDVVFHLAGAEHQGARADLFGTDIKGTETLARVLADLEIKRLFYVSHLGADRASAFPVFKAKAIAEEYIRRSGVPHTIFRAAILYGPEDHFTSGLARLISLSPVIFFASRSDTLVQPLWVEDLITSMVWSLDNEATIGQTYEIGGGEFFTVREVMDNVMKTIGKRRILLPLSMPYLRGLTVAFEQWFPKFPSSVFWLDYMSVNRTCPVDSIPRLFGFLPARFTYRLDHLKSVDWGKQARQMIMDRSHA